MSSFMPWVARALTIVFITTMSTVLVGISAASAADWPQPPLVLDRCGTSQDQVYVHQNPPNTGFTMYDTTGRGYTDGMYHSTNGVASITFVVTDYGTTGAPQYTYPTVSFGTEADSTCVEAADTVTFSDSVCNPSTNGTAVTFTYINVDDSTDRSHTTPYVDVVRWDGGQSARVIFTVGPVADGQQLTRRGGDDPSGYQGNFFLAPGTYNLTLTTEEKGEVKLPNRLFVPACGEYKVPQGDPHGGATTPPSAPATLPKGVLKQVTKTKMRVTAINKGVLRPTTFKVVVNPKVGMTTTKTLKVAKGKSLVRSYKAPARTRFVLKARVLVKDASGRLVNKWKVLKRSTLKSR